MKIIQTFWHGNKISLYERLSIASFLKQGHEVHLYSYDPIILPENAQWRDASEILPESSVFSYHNGFGKGSFAAFANNFRYKLLLERGGIWSDLDVLCLAPLDDLPDSFIGKQNEHELNNAVMGLTQNSAFARHLFEQATSSGTNVRWGQTGPGLVTRLYQSKEFSEITSLPSKTFYPIPWQQAFLTLQPEKREHCMEATRDALCLHWWNEILRDIGIPKDKLPPRGSYLATHAEKLLPANELCFWDEGIVNKWLKNFFNAQNFLKLKNMQS